MDLCTKEGTDNRARPLILLFEWLGAKKKHVLKYSEYYFTKGYDSMLIRIQPVPLLWPVKVQAVVDEIFDTLDKDTMRERPVIVHTFSVGGYFYGELLVRMQQTGIMQKYRDRVLGQIFDSPVDFAGIPNGFSKAVSKNPAVRAGLKHSLRLYLSTFSEYTMKHYLRSSKAFYDNPLNIPSLFLYSLADPIADPVTIDKCIKGFEDKGLLTLKKCWNDSTHCSHMYRYPSEYQNAIGKFLDEVTVRSSQGPNFIEKVPVKN
jgi:hypothetical protein